MRRAWCRPMRRAVPRSTRFRKGKTCGAIGLEHGRRIHFKLLLDVGAAGIRSRCLGRKCRGPDPAAGDDILNADVRPYRNGTAATSDENGRGVDHGRGYKAAPGFRQAQTTVIQGARRMLIGGSFEVNEIGPEFPCQRGFRPKGNRPVFACTVRPAICNVAPTQEGFCND